MREVVVVYNFVLKIVVDAIILEFTASAPFLGRQRLF